MPQLYKKVDLRDGAPVQYVGVYVTRWQREWGEPQVGFIEVDDEETPEEAIAND